MLSTRRQLSNHANFNAFGNPCLAWETNNAFATAIALSVAITAAIAAAAANDTAALLGVGYSEDFP